jgi:hypothetical protein
MVIISTMTTKSHASVSTAARAAFLSATLLAAATMPAPAAEPDAETVGTLFNWYYATSFGTGAYTVGDTVVTVLTLPLGYTLREPDAEHWGIRLTLPASLALGSFDLYNPALDQIDDINLAAWSVLPGLELTIPLAPHWRVNPFANVGWAQERETRGGAALYQAGVSTLYAVPEITYPEIAIGARYLYAGYRSEGADSEPISMAALGLGATFPTSWTLAHGRQVNVGLHWIGRNYFSDLRFRLPAFGYTEIHGEHEIGVVLGLRPAVKVLGVPFNRIGFSYVMANNGLRGVRLVTEFPF